MYTYPTGNLNKDYI